MLRTQLTPQQLQRLAQLDQTVGSNPQPRGFDASYYQRGSDRFPNMPVTAYRSPGRISRDVGIAPDNQAVFPEMVTTNIHNSPAAQAQLQTGLARGLMDPSSTFRSKLQDQIAAKTQLGLSLPQGSPRRAALSREVQQLKQNLGQARADQIQTLATEPYLSQSFRKLNTGSRITGYTGTDHEGNPAKATTGAKALQVQTGQRPSTAAAAQQEVAALLQSGELPASYSNLQNPRAQQNYAEAVKAKALMAAPAEELTQMGYRLKPQTDQTVLDLYEGPRNYFMQRDGQGGPHFIPLDRALDPQTNAPYQQYPTQINNIKAGQTINELYSDITDPLTGDPELRQPIQNQNYGTRAGYLKSQNLYREDKPSYNDPLLLQENTFGPYNRGSQGLQLDRGNQFSAQAQNDVVNYLTGVDPNAPNSAISVVPQQSVNQSIANSGSTDFSGYSARQAGNLLQEGIDNFNEVAGDRIRAIGTTVPPTRQQYMAAQQEVGIPMHSKANNQTFGVQPRSSYMQTLAKEQGWDGPYDPEFSPSPSANIDLNRYNIYAQGSAPAPTQIDISNINNANLYSSGVLDSTTARRLFDPQENKQLRLAEYMQSPEYQVGTGQIPVTPLGDTNLVIQSSNPTTQYQTSVDANQALAWSQGKNNEQLQNQIQELSRVTQQTLPSGEVITAGTTATRINDPLDATGTAADLYQQIYSDPSLASQLPSRVDRSFISDSIADANPNLVPNFQRVESGPMSQRISPVGTQTTDILLGDQLASELPSAAEMHHYVNRTLSPLETSASPIDGTEVQILPSQMVEAGPSTGNIAVRKQTGYQPGTIGDANVGQAPQYLNLASDPAQVEMVNQQIQSNRIANRQRAAELGNRVNTNQDWSNLSDREFLPQYDVELQNMSPAAYQRELELSNAMDDMILRMRSSQEGSRAADSIAANAGMPTNQNAVPSRPGLSDSTNQTLAQMRDLRQAQYQQKVNQAQQQFNPEAIAALKAKAERKQQQINQQSNQQTPQQSTQQGGRVAGNRGQQSQRPNRYGARTVDKNSPAARRLRARFNR